MLNYQGKIAGKSVRTFQSGAKSITLKFTQNTPDGDLIYFEVRVPEEMEHEHLKAGDQVTVPLEYYVSQNRAFFKATSLPASKPVASMTPSPAPAAIQAKR